MEQISPKASIDGKYIQLQARWVGLPCSTRNKNKTQNVAFTIFNSSNYKKPLWNCDISTDAIKPHPKWSKQKTLKH